MWIGRMKKDFIVSRIESAEYGAPYVYVTVRDPNDYKSGGAGRRLVEESLWFQCIYITGGFDEKST